MILFDTAMTYNLNLDVIVKKPATCNIKLRGQQDNESNFFIRVLTSSGDTSILVLFSIVTRAGDV